jgi:hypothetical protein
MKIPAHFDPSIGIESISIKEPTPTQKLLPERSPAGSKEALSLALVNNFLTYRLKHFWMNSLSPEILAQADLFKDRLKHLLKLLSEEEEIKETELLLFVQEDCDRQETLMEERQKQIGP